MIIWWLFDGHLGIIWGSFADAWDWGRLEGTPTYGYTTWSVCTSATTKSNDCHGASSIDEKFTISGIRLLIIKSWWKLNVNGCFDTHDCHFIHVGEQNPELVLEIGSYHMIDWLQGSSSIGLSSWSLCRCGPKFRAGSFTQSIKWEDGLEVSSRL